MHIYAIKNKKKMATAIGGLISGFAQWKQSFATLGENKFQKLQT